MTFIDNSDQVKRNLNDAIEKWLTASTKLVKNEAQGRARFDTGALRDSIQNEVDMSEKAGYTGSTTEHGIYNELGTGEHAINGNGRKGGWVYPTGDGEFRFTFGLRPQRFLLPSFQNNFNNIQSLLKSYLSEL